MKRTYYNLNLNTELEQCYLAVEEADQVQVLKLHGSGVLEGLETTQNDPAADMNVLIGAGYAWDGNGTLLNPTETGTVDCSVDEESVSTIPSSGKERYIVIAVEADREVTSGTVSNTDEDSHAYVVVSGDEADPGEAVAPELTDGRIHLAKVLLDESTTAITDAMIDTSDRPEIITVAKHVADDEAHAAEDITYDNSTSGLTATNVQEAIDEMEERVESFGSGLGGGVKVFDTSGTFEPGQDGVPSWVTQVWVEAVGAGGGGGYVQASGFNGNSAGGGGGGYAAGWVGVEAGISVTVTVGAGGTAGTSGTVDGTDGGTSSFGAAVSAAGGSGGESINTAYGSKLQIAGGAKASCVGDIAEDGGPGCPSGGDYTAYPYGGCSRFGHSGSNCFNTGSNASNIGAVGPGAGGRGSFAGNGYVSAGTDGLDGQVRVFWYGAAS